MVEAPPALVFFAGALLVAVLPRRIGSVVLLAVPLVALGQITLLEPGAGLAWTFYGFELEPLRVDRLSLAFGYVFCGVGFLAGLYGLRTMGRAERVAALAYAGSALAVVFAGDLLTLFVGWELKAVGSALVIWTRGTPASGAAGLRYLYAQLIGGKLLLGGALWHYAETGSLVFEAFAASPAAVLVLLAFMLSAAVPPLHAWLPDAYPTASVAGTVFLSAYTTKAAVYALARGFPGYEVLVWAGVVMALYGVFYAMLANDIRRLLAYHIVSQVGFMVAAVGIGTQEAINGATAHAFAHIIYKGLLLMGAGAVLYATGRSKASELGGLARLLPWTLVLYLVGAVSISGVPLFSGFVSKELSIAAASLDGRAAVVVLLKIASVGTFLSTTLKLPYATWFGRTPADAPPGGLQQRPVAPSMYAAMGAAAVLNLVIGLAPGAFYGLLPFTVDYDPYTLGKVVETSQILLFTAVGFWLLAHKLKSAPTIALDVDWLYRVLPRRVLAGVQPVRERLPRPAPNPSWRRGLTGLRGQVSADGRTASPVYPTWLLGATIIGVSMILLGLSLVP